MRPEDSWLPIDAFIGLLPLALRVALQLDINVLAHRIIFAVKLGPNVTVIERRVHAERQKFRYTAIDVEIRVEQNSVAVHVLEENATLRGFLLNFGLVIHPLRGDAFGRSLFPHIGAAGHFQRFRVFNFTDRRPCFQNVLWVEFRGVAVQRLLELHLAWSVVPVSFGRANCDVPSICILHRVPHRLVAIAYRQRFSDPNFQLEGVAV